MTSIFEMRDILGMWVDSLMTLWDTLQRPVVEVLGVEWFYFFATDDVKYLISQQSVLDFILGSLINIMIISLILKGSLSFITGIGKFPWVG